MRKSKNRIVVWVVVIILLALAAAYYYVSTNGSKLGSNTISDNNYLIYLSSDKKIVRYGVESKTKKTLLDANIYSPVSVETIQSSDDQPSALLLKKASNKFYLSLLNMTSGDESQKIDVTSLSPSIAYYINSNFYILVSDTDQKQLTAIDAKGETIWQNSFDQKIVSISDDSSEDNIFYTTFDGSVSKIHKYTRSTNVSSDLESYQGQIYKFDKNKVLYSKKSVTNDNTVDPAGQALWQVAVANRVTKSENIVSDGTFDVNAVAFNSNINFAMYNIIAFQKLSDTNQNDGIINLIKSGGQPEVIDSGLPLALF